MRDITKIKSQYIPLIDETERKIQDITKQHLMNKYKKDYWSLGIKPILVKDKKYYSKIKERGEDIRNIDFPKLKEVIFSKKNWDECFKEIFQYYKSNKENRIFFEKAFEGFYDLRNLISHTRPEEEYDQGYIDRGTNCMNIIRGCIGLDSLFNISSEYQIKKDENDGGLSEIDRLWEKIDIITRPNDAKDINEKFNEIIKKSDDKEIKIIAKHGKALTAQKYTESVNNLLKIFEDSPDYSGYRNHNILQDIFKEYWQLIINKNGKNYSSKMMKVLTHIIDNYDINLLLDIFCNYYSDLNDDLLKEVGDLLYEKNPDNIDLLEALTEINHDQDSEEAWQYWKKLIYNSNDPGKFAHYIRSFEDDFAGCDDYELVLNILKDTTEFSNIDYHECLSFHYFRKYENASSKKQKEKYSRLVEKEYKCLYKFDSSNIHFIRNLFYWYNKKDFEKMRKFGYDLINHYKSINEDFISFSIMVFSYKYDKFKEADDKYKPEVLKEPMDIILKGIKEYPGNDKLHSAFDVFYDEMPVDYRDYSAVIEILQDEIGKNPDNENVHARLGHIYNKVLLYGLAIKHYNIVLKNPGHVPNRSNGIYYKLLPKLEFDMSQRGMRYKQEYISDDNSNDDDEYIVRNLSNEKRMLSELEIDCLDSIIDLYLRLHKYPEAHDLCERLRKIPITNCKEHCKPVYNAYSKYLQEMK